MLAKRNKVTWRNTQGTVNARENCSRHGYVPTQKEYDHHFFCSLWNPYSGWAVNTSWCADASHSLGWLLCGFLSRCNLLMRHHLLTHCPVAALLLVALPSRLPRLVVASPLVTLPWPLDVPTAASQHAVASPHASALTSHLPLVKNTPPAPSRLFFLTLGINGWVDKDGSNGWFFVGWCAVSHPPACATKIWVTSLFGLAQKNNFGTAHKVFVHHIHL
jgi:hypothetical protein